VQTPIALSLVLGLLVAAGAEAQEASDLAKKAQNPIGSMISLPFEFPFNFENGTDDDDVQSVLQVQPVVPFGITESWNVIARPIIPLISQPEQAQIPFPPIVTKTGGRTFGLGDINLSLFFSPKSETGFVWGAGPVMAFPTASNAALGTEKWSAGPTGVVVYSTGPWMLGTRAGQLWSFAGTSDRSDVSSFVLQPFANYKLPNGWYLSTSPMMIANWKAKGGDTWTVPVGGGVGKIFSIGSQNINTRLTLYYNAARPEGAADFSLQWTLQFLFPK
jgi:hypothetical protein